MVIYIHMNTMFNFLKSNSVGMFGRTHDIIAFPRLSRYEHAVTLR